jgi:hypothetical protein
MVSERPLTISFSPMATWRFLISSEDMKEEEKVVRSE